MRCRLSRRRVRLRGRQGPSPSTRTAWRPVRMTHVATDWRSESLPATLIDEEQDFFKRIDLWVSRRVFLTPPPLLPCNPDSRADRGSATPEVPSAFLTGWRRRASNQL